MSYDKNKRTCINTLCFAFSAQPVGAEEEFVLAGGFRYVCVLEAGGRGWPALNERHRVCALDNLAVVVVFDRRR